MEHLSAMAALSLLPRLYDTSIDSYVGSPLHSRSIPSSPSLWYLH